jgi:hypothetical protein
MSRFLLFACLGLSALPVARANPLVCPEGSALKTGYHDATKTSFEWCIDRNGVKQGPFRATNDEGHLVSDGYRRDGKLDGVYHLYDGKGKLRMTFVYKNGKELSSQLSDEALTEQFDGLNRSARAQGKAWQISLPTKGPFSMT